MALKAKFSFWIVWIAVVIVLFFAVPAVSKSSWSDMVGSWLDEYEEAVESAQADDDDDDHADSDEDDEQVAHMQVRIDDEISDYVGIETRDLVATTFFPEFKAVAEVVDIRDMLALKTRYQHAVSAVQIERVATASAKQEYDRLNKLATGSGSIASKKVNYAKATLNEANAKLSASSVVLQSIENEAMQTWGQPIAGWLLTEGSKPWQRLLTHQDSLLLLTLAVDDSLPADLSFIRISRDGSREQARKAYLVSPALSTDTLLQGETYFFKTATGKLRRGMRLDAWITKDDEPLQGVFVPDDAIIWHEGQPWVYVELEDELYKRKSIKDSISSAGGRFVESGLDAGEELVVKGAQMLLSEEYKWQIADEDDD